MMESKVQKQIIDYFSTVEEFHNTSKACLKTCQNCANSINKLVRRCNNIKQAELAGTPLEQFVDLQDRLSAAIHNLISVEIQEIKKQAQLIEPLFEKLCYKSNTLKENCKDFDFSEQSPLVKGTPLQPPLQLILNFVDDSITYGSLYGALIESSLNILALKGSNSESQVDNLKIPANWQNRVAEILAYTSFCSENHI